MMAMHRQRAPRATWWWVLALLGLTGCGPEQVPATDTTGEGFLFACSEQDRCEIEFAEEPRCGTKAMFMQGRYLLACASHEGLTYLGDCRPIACGPGEDCPGDSYACGDDGLCQNPESDIYGADVFAMCMQEVSRDEVCFVGEFGAENPRVATANAAANGCSLGPCLEIPEDCR